MELKIKDGQAKITGELMQTEPFLINFPSLIERTGYLSDGRAVYTLTYLIKEVEKQ